MSVSRSLHLQCIQSDSEAEENPTSYTQGEKKLLCAIITRVIFDIEQYLQLLPQKRNIYAFKLAKEAHDYIHNRALHKQYYKTPFSFNYIMEQLFNSANANEAIKIKKEYQFLPDPFQPHPDDESRQRKSYRSAIVRYNF